MNRSNCGGSHFLDKRGPLGEVPEPIRGRSLKSQKSEDDACRKERHRYADDGRYEACSSALIVTIPAPVVQQ